MAISVEDLLNSALRRIRYPTPIGSIYEGSAAARVALDFYGQTRDNLFGAQDWPFLRREVSLGAPTKTAPPGGYGVDTWDPTTNPPPPWIYQYAYPDFCIEIRALRPVPIFIPEFTPQFTRFVTAYDTVVQQKVVLTNLYQPLAVMTGQINNPNEWKDSNFTEAFIDALAEQFLKHDITGDVQRLQLAEMDKTKAVEVASTRRG